MKKNANTDHGTITDHEMISGHKIRIRRKEICRSLRKVPALMLILLMLPLVLTACASSSTQTSTKTDDYGPATKVEIEVEDYGTIKLDLYADVAPVTVANFVKLAKDGFYDGLTFHRVINNFMIQGGDPQGNGLGGSDQNIVGEFQMNGHPNPLLHNRGTISMARAKDYNSASSQFFICQKDSHHLDGSYAAFGVVTEGMEIVDTICQMTPVKDSNGTVPKDSRPVIKKITVVEEAKE